MFMHIYIYMTIHNDCYNSKGFKSNHGFYALNFRNNDSVLLIKYTIKYTIF